MYYVYEQVSQKYSNTEAVQKR